MLIAAALSDGAAAVLLGLGTAACAGLGSFAGQRMTAGVGWLRAAWTVQAAALAPVVITALLWSGAPTVDVAVLHALGLGLLNVVSLIGLYRAFASGSLAIVGPIASSYAAVTVAMAIVAGEPPSPRLGLGLAAVIVGVAIASAARGAADDGRPARAAGVAWAVLSSLSFGAVFFWLAPVSAELGPVWPVAWMRVTGVVALGLLRAFVPTEAARPVPIPLLIACVLFDSGGLVVYALGAGLGGAALVAVLASLSSVITVVLARWRLHERLSPPQWIGVGLVLAGTAWISYHAHAA